MFDKESVKVKKETLECINQVIKDAKKNRRNATQNN